LSDCVLVLVIPLESIVRGMEPLTQGGETRRDDEGSVQVLDDGVRTDLPTRVENVMVVLFVHVVVRGQAELIVYGALRSNL
jgi:hypothetical protein